MGSHPGATLRWLHQLTVACASASLLPLATLGFFRRQKDWAARELLQQREQNFVNDARAKVTRVRLCYLWLA